MTRLTICLPAGVRPRGRWPQTLLLAALVGSAAGCTTFDRLFPPIDAPPGLVGAAAAAPAPAATPLTAPTTPAPVPPAPAAAAATQTAPAPAITATATATATAFDARCTAVVAAGHRPPTGRSNEAIAERARPAKGAAIADPAYGNCLMRLTAHDSEPPVGTARHDEARRQAFNADGRRVVVRARQGQWHLYDGSTLAWQRALPVGAGPVEPQWHPADPDLLRVLHNDADSAALVELDVRRDRRRVVGDFLPRLRQAWPDTSAITTRGLGSPSADGRYWCLIAADGQGRSLGVFTWDLQTDALLGLMQTNGVELDHVSMSPSGRHCVVASHASGVGTRAWSRDFQTSVPLHHRTEHADLARDAAGRDVYVSVDYQTANGEVFMVDLDTGKRTTLLPTALNGTTTAIRFSGRNLDRPGWIVASTWATSPNGGARQWLHEKVFALSLSDNPVVRTLAHHRSAGKDYQSQPQASVNRDFTRVIFNSTWSSTASTDVDTWLVWLRPGALDD